MHDDVVSEVCGQEEELVAEIEIFLACATSPTPSLIANSHAIVRELIVFVKQHEAREHQLARLFLVCQIVFCY